MLTPIFSVLLHVFSPTKGTVFFSVFEDICLGHFIMQRLLMTESSLVEENIKDPTATATTKEGGADEGEDEGDRKETINWGEALEQCGDDEEFLRELLSDLKEEVVQNHGTIADALDSTPEDWADAIRRAAHAIKGAAANLMCHELNHAALVLESRAKLAITPETASRELPLTFSFLEQDCARKICGFSICRQTSSNFIVLCSPADDITDLRKMATKLRYAVNHYVKFVDSASS
mmetsp:Transcript_51659/g.88605  ORF Transcript_51659/g.88605 Transcript_51659/m.88605 type:complete len:234 (-) Transcript_51659:263-964(-)